MNKKCHQCCIIFKYPGLSCIGMLNGETIKKIEGFVYSKPRSMQEIANLLEKNWRTVDKYVDEIKKNFGTIDTRTFRGGTRGALKIIYWSSIEKVSNSVFQEKIEKDILNGKNKQDFSPFDMFQYINNRNKKAILEKNERDTNKNMEEYFKLIKETKNQLLIFSGNLSFINFKVKGFDILDAFEDLVKKKISIKIICRVDIVGKKNVEKVLSLNFKHGTNLIEIHHREQPLRGAVLDSKLIRLTEIKFPTEKMNELENEIAITYILNDKEWAKWLSQIFWKMFSSSIGANKRIEELSKISK